MLPDYRRSLFPSRLPTIDPNYMIMITLVQGPCYDIGLKHILPLVFRGEIWDLVQILLTCIRPPFPITPNRVNANMQDRMMRYAHFVEYSEMFRLLIEIGLNA